MLGYEMKLTTPPLKSSPHLTGSNVKLKTICFKCLQSITISFSFLLDTVTLRSSTATIGWIMSVEYMSVSRFNFVLQLECITFGSEAKQLAICHYYIHRCGAFQEALEKRWDQYEQEEVLLTGLLFWEQTFFPVSTMPRLIHSRGLS